MITGLVFQVVLAVLWLASLVALLTRWGQPLRGQPVSQWVLVLTLGWVLWWGLVVVGTGFHMATGGIPKWLEPVQGAAFVLLAAGGVWSAVLMVKARYGPLTKGRGDHAGVGPEGRP